MITEEDQSGEMNAVLVLAKISAKLKMGRRVWGTGGALGWGFGMRGKGVRVGEWCLVVWGLGSGGGGCGMSIGSDCGMRVEEWKRNGR